MNPYDRRGVRSVWARVSPGRDVFAPGPWAGPPAPVGPPGPSAPPPGQGGKPPQGAPPPPEPPAQQALDLLAQLAGGYDCLARQRRAPLLRRLAAQCRRNAEALRGCSGLRPRPTEPGRVSVQTQRDREQTLRGCLEQIDPACARLAGNLANESKARSRQLARFR